MRRLWTAASQAGPGIEASRGRMLFPIARSLRVGWPGAAAGLVWNRPVSILVEEAGSYRHVRVPDRTRELQWLILGAGLTIGLLIRVAARPRRGFSGR
ncbi:MAG: hypothetical protein ABI968_10390 [Acidobacteriota bacterium]